MKNGIKIHLKNILIVIIELIYCKEAKEMILLAFFIGIVCIIFLVNNVIAIIYKIKEGKENTIKNTFVCCITLIYLWISTILIASIG